MFEGWLEGKVTVVTGAGRGIGRAIAIAMASAGADVALASRTEPELESAAEEIRGLGRRALVVRTDASVETDMTALVARTVAELGALDVMVNNAGVAPFLATFLDTRPDGFEKHFGINFWSAVYGTRAAG
ncbi:MAG TPA: SDR family NAD(P)-dependent oxidoreductase, partial [Actinomycetota bacterium]|nr:SDR family NAD(P)-dependent oxidoreductase [Actinomycetota bacterium]